MTYFVVEHERNGPHCIDIVTGVEDIDTNYYQPLIGLWVCASEQEAHIMENELRKMRNERSSQPS
jgi:hypothetical protein